MKKILSMTMLAAALSACGTYGLMPVPDVTPDVTGGEIVVDLVYYSTGDLKSIKTVWTQPALSFVVAAGSAGMTVTSFEAEVLDTNGVNIGTLNSQYQRSLTVQIPSGFTCGEPGGTDECSPLERTPSSRTVIANGAELFLAQLSDEIGDICAAFAECPTLQMKLTFRGFDDNGRQVVIPLAENASIQARIASISVEDPETTTTP